MYIDYSIWIKELKKATTDINEYNRLLCELALLEDKIKINLTKKAIKTKGYS